MLWRLMTSSDLPQVSAMGNGIHVDFYEDPKVFVERHRLYPQGCYVLEDGDDIKGYIVSHPWYFKQPPALNSFLQAIPEPASTYYLHDVALLPSVRGDGHASYIVETIIKHALQTNLPNLSLISVNGTAPFWGQHGFQLHQDPALDAKLRTYEEDAQFMVRNL